MSGATASKLVRPLLPTQMPGRQQQMRPLLPQGHEVAEWIRPLRGGPRRRAGATAGNAGSARRRRDAALLLRRRPSTAAAVPRIAAAATLR